MPARLLQDTRFAFRAIRKTPVFIFVVVISIGLAIGVNTTIFTWMESLILNPYPAVPDAHKLAALNTAYQEENGNGAPPISYPTFKDWRDAAQSFDGMFVEAVVRLNIRPEGQPSGTPVWGEMVSGNYFDVLHLPPALGRTFLPDEEQTAAPVAVISHSLWQRMFDGDPAVVNRHVLLNGLDVAIVGIAPPNFGGVMVGYGFDLWVPVTLQPLVMQGSNHLINRGDRWLQATARLKPDITIQQANAEMRALARQLSEAHGEYPASSAVVRRMRDRFAGPLLSPLFSILLVVTGLVLLIACANVANLLLARATSRQKEIGIRLAMGASRGRIIQQLLTESLLLSLSGGVMGLLFALWAKDIFGVFIPQTSQPVRIAINLNARIIGFMFLTTIATALVFGLVPALRASRIDLIPVLKDESRSFGASRSKLRGALIVIQVAFSVVSLVCAGLFLRSLQTGKAMDLGFSDPSHVLLAATDLNVAGLKEEAGLASVDRLLERVRSLPGVRAASFSTMVPLGFGGHNYSVTKVEGYSPAPDEQVSVERIVVTDDYFETMGIPLASGRGIAAQDLRDGLRVAVVNEAFARRYWPGIDPVGKHLDQGQGWATVVGVAKDSAYNDLGETPYPVVYSSLHQWYTPIITLHVRTVTDPKAHTEAVRSQFSSVNADLPFLDPRTLKEHISASTFVQFIGASMLTAFGTLALLLSAVGLYGVLSYVVNQRGLEIAIRIAIGATPKDILRLIFKQGAGLTLLGIAIGVASALAAGQLLRNQLLGVNPADPLTFITVASLLSVIALSACFFPAWRASRTDPVAALKSE
jgi:predicted permease